jgi:hypothetical protein
VDHSLPKRIACRQGKDSDIRSNVKDGPDRFVNFFESVAIRDENLKKEISSTHIIGEIKAPPRARNDNRLWKSKAPAADEPKAE